MLLLRLGYVIRDLGGSVHIWGYNEPVLISYFYDGAAPVRVFLNRSRSQSGSSNMENVNNTQYATCGVVQAQH